jgi:alanyl-tRNA synthetase
MSEKVPLTALRRSSEIRRSFLDFFREKSHTIVPSSSLLPDAPNLLFTNAGMNQFVPIFLGQEPCPYRPARAADTQKCIRAGGKHNDLEDVGFDTYHHTFFEMLGNWSFGDYFKKEAIAWAWELVVARWNFPASRLYATVYQPGPGEPAVFDQEAFDAWAAIFTQAGLDPAVHIVNGNKKDNFWMMGDTGPCGPCSELHVDLTPGPRELSVARQQTGRELVNRGDARCIEIWNLVFIQFNANPDGTFVELPAKHVDTGMGFERVTSMIQGTKGLTDFSESVKISNYETDVFRPIFDELEKLTGKKYHSTLPASAQNLSEQEKVDVAFRVIADHIRTLSFSIADGIHPSNEGRGYVLRRILRRAVRYGRNLGLREPFLGRLVDVLGVTMGEIFPEVVKRADAIKKTLTQEEESFFRTLERGIELFESAVAAVHERRIFSGSEAFKLYDTYGFPLDLTELMARERGMSVDVSEFDRLMDEQKAKGKAAQKKEVITVEDSGKIGELRPTTFYGYDELQTPSLVVANENGAVAVSETPFYAEMGGQVGDTGEMQYLGRTFAVTNTVRSGQIIFHKVAEPMPAEVGETVILRVDGHRRAKIEAHHSGTHLLNWALRKVLGDTVVQRGSYVGPDRLRFDFSHGTAVTPEQLTEIEKLINEKIEANVPVTWEERPYAEVKGDPSILQFFGDKYGDVVRVVSIGSFSRELCGGTHVRHSGDVGFFKIISEGAIAAGIRRIEAVSGAALIRHVEDELPKQEVQYSALRQRKIDLAALSAYSGDPTPHMLWRHWESREVTLKSAAALVALHEKEEAKRQEAGFQKRAATDAAGLIESARPLNNIPFLTKSFHETPAAYLPILADALKARWQGVAVLAAIDQDKVALLCSVSPAYTKRIQAGKIIQTIAPLVGGKGGGRPELAQGGGTNPGGVLGALNQAEELVHQAPLKG